VQTIICSHCQTDEVRRVHRKGPIERWVLPKLAIYPFICGMCYRRFRAKVREEKPVPELYVAAIPTRSMPQA
jgi:hypothetical protein